MNVLELLKSKGIEPKLSHRCSKRGPEYWSSCPGCGGDIGSDGLPSNRFHVWPEQNNGSGSFWCRGCGAAGDNITFLMKFDGKSYPEACAALDIELKKEEYRTPKPKKSGAEDSRGQGFKGSRAHGMKKKADLPGGLWVEKAGKLVEWAHEALLKNREQMKWLAKRGIQKESVVRFKLGWNPGKDGRDLWRPRESWGLATEMKKNKNGKMVKKRLWIPRGLVVPEIRRQTTDDRRQVVRIRIRRPEENPPRFYVIPGSNMDVMVINQTTDDRQQMASRRAFVVVESELDAVLLAQEAGDLAGMVALGSSSAKPDEKLMERLRKSAVILLSQDYDTAGAKAVKWWEETFPQSKRWPVRRGADPGEAFGAGCDIRAWISAGLPEGWRIGRSLLGKKIEGADPEMEDKKVRGSEDEKGRAIAPAVLELAELLKKHPVSILNAPDRTSILESQKWVKENWEVSKRISELVYMTPEVFEYLAGHPEQMITGGNIILT